MLAAVVWSFGALSPTAQFSYETALIIQGDTPAEDMINTGSGWKVLNSGAYTPNPPSREEVFHYNSVGPGERLDGSRYPWGWETEGYEGPGLRSRGAAQPSGTASLYPAPGEPHHQPQTEATHFCEVFQTLLQCLPGNLKPKLEKDHESQTPHTRCRDAAGDGRDRHC